MTVNGVEMQNRPPWLSPAPIPVPTGYVPKPAPKEELKLPTIELAQATSAPEILDAAARHLRDRAATYDKPEGERSMGQTVEIFNTFHKTALTEAQGWHLLQILKDVRLFTRSGYHADSAEDCTSYSALKAEAKAREVAA